MPKLKTHKSTTKRFRVSGAGKLMRRKAGQNHFNARERGVVTTRKRRDLGAPDATAKTIKALTPYT